MSRSVSRNSDIQPHTRPSCHPTTPSPTRVVSQLTQLLASTPRRSCEPSQGPHARLLRGKRAANQRPSKVIYDRDYSSIALAKPGDINWDHVFAGAGWFHITGITPAISATAADLALESVAKAQAAGLTVSCDLNYRKNLWKWGKPAAEVMQQLIRHVDVAIANEEDCQMALGVQSDVDVHSGKLDRWQRYRGLAEKVLSQFPKLKIHCHHLARIAQRVAQRMVGVFSYR